MGDKGKRKGFSLERYIYHELVSVMLAALFIVYYQVPAYAVMPFILFALIGGITPNIDEWLHIGHRNPLLHSFLLPFLFWLALPKSLVLTAFTVGYLGHLIDDTAKSRQYWVIVDEKVGVALLWASVLILMAMLLGWHPSSLLS